MRYTFNLPDVAARIETAVRKALASGLRTGDIAKANEAKASTKQLGDAVVSFL